MNKEELYKLVNDDVDINTKKHLIDKFKEMLEIKEDDFWQHYFDRYILCIKYDNFYIEIGGKKVKEMEDVEIFLEKAKSFISEQKTIFNYNMKKLGEDNIEKIKSLTGSDFECVFIFKDNYHVYQIRLCTKNNFELEKTETALIYYDEIQNRSPMCGTCMDWNPSYKVYDYNQKIKKWEIDAMLNKLEELNGDFSSVKRFDKNVIMMR